MPTLQLDDATFPYEVRGTGTPLLLIAGTALGGSTWPDAFLDRLAERHAVVTYDNRGTGGSTDEGSPYTTRQFAGDAAALLQALDLGSAHALGHSMGGRVAQWLALDHPELLRTLILASSGPGSFPGLFPQGQEMPCGIPLRLALAVDRLGYERYVHERLRDTFFSPSFQRDHPDEVARHLDRLTDRVPTLEAYYKHIIARQAHQTADQLGDIRTPTLVLIGDQDLYQGDAGHHWEQSEFMRDHIPGAEMQVLEGHAHGYIWQASDEAADVVTAWTARHDA